MRLFNIRRFASSLFLLGVILAVPDAAAQNGDSIRLENLGGSVNSIYDDVGPIISPDGRTLYFDRTNDPNNVGNDDIWFSTLQRDATWSLAKNIGTPLNNEDHNFVSAVTPDGNTLLLGNVYNPDGTMGPGVSISHRTRRGWGMPVKLNIRNYYSLGLSANYTLANDGKTLLMAVERGDGYGDLDLYVSFVQEDGTWSEPRSLGPEVNTRGADRTPFLAADGVSLYYASDGLGGYGNSDIFVTRRLDSTWRKWSRPENLGRPINTEGWDGFFTIPASGDYAYMVSTQSGYGSADIFKVRLPESMRPRPVVLVSGKVVNAKTKAPIAATVTYRTTRGANEGVARTDPTTGEYKVVLPVGSDYTFLAEAEGYNSVRENIGLAKVDTYKEVTRDFMLDPLKVGSTVRLQSVLFPTGVIEVQPEAYAELDRLVDVMRENSEMQIAISGHTDNVGPDAANLDLSERRAAAVMEYLVKQGVERGRLASRGYGERRPVGPNSTDEGRRLNRRVEFTIVKQ